MKLRDVKDTVIGILQVVAAIVVYTIFAVLMALFLGFTARCLWETLTMGWNL
jgi:hypothetical protein